MLNQTLYKKSVQQMMEDGWLLVMYLCHCKLLFKRTLAKLASCYFTSVYLWTCLKFHLKWRGNTSFPDSCNIWSALFHFFVIPTFPLKYCAKNVKLRWQDNKQCQCNYWKINPTFVLKLSKIVWWNGKFIIFYRIFLKKCYFGMLEYLQVMGRGNEQINR